MKYISILIVLSTLFGKLYVSQFQEKEEIIVYGSDTCHYCIDTKEFLNKNKIKFVYYDVDLNIEKQTEMVEKLKKAKISLSNLNLPVIDKQGEIFTNSEDFEAFLHKIKED